MVEDAIGIESDEEPFATDGDEDYDYVGENKKEKKGSRDDDDGDSSDSAKITPKKQAKNNAKGATKRAPKVVEPSKLQLKKEEQMKLAGLIKEEDVIFNINNKLHANGPAVAAAWKRVATKMEIERFTRMTTTCSLFRVIKLYFNDT